MLFSKHHRTECVVGSNRVQRRCNKEPFCQGKPLVYGCVSLWYTGEMPHCSNENQRGKSVNRDVFNAACICGCHSFASLIVWNDQNIRWLLTKHIEPAVHVPQSYILSLMDWKEGGFLCRMAFITLLYLFLMDLSFGLLCWMPFFTLLYLHSYFTLCVHWVTKRFIRVVNEVEQKMDRFCVKWCCGTPPLRWHESSIRPCAERLRLVLSLYYVYSMVHTYKCSVWYRRSGVWPLP